ncbi:hypothetical protein GCM10010123_43110 [Pilimelia anulata]|uniref:Uncharacterized protein n=1 Tax=Pilimelia anulata TaxID=53371 RepID=A0A8J3BB63_9ACTN|nr:hypothetical protein [Pilimelia anulata]GGK08602.1 hypothetical protein GCM10010123_43110 [Pilimelia anulata]
MSDSMRNLAEAVFLSDLQPSASPDAAAVEAAVAATLARYGWDGCGPAVAGEFGERAETALPRLLWARRLVAEHAAATPALAA